MEWPARLAQSRAFYAGELESVQAVQPKPYQMNRADHSSKSDAD